MGRKARMENIPVKVLETIYKQSGVAFQVSGGKIVGYTASTPKGRRVKIIITGGEEDGEKADC